MTQEKKINYMRISAGMACLGFSNEQLDKLVCIYELVIEKQGDSSLKDVAKIESECKKRADIKSRSKLLDKVSEKL